MRILGIIAEYNPFHNGHLFHLKKSLQKSKATHTVAIMSGHFLQRGEPALTDKWSRAKAAVDNGVDLVIELPFAYACQSAEIFAYGAVSILNQMNIVDVLSFGSEEEDLTQLLNISGILAQESPDFKIQLKKGLQDGLSFPKARQQAIEQITGASCPLIQKSNAILGIEYLKWLNRLHSTIEPMIIKRHKTEYHSDKAVEGFAGATYIRNLLLSKKASLREIQPLVPKETYQMLLAYRDKAPFNQLENYFALIKRELLVTTPDEFSDYQEIREGLENRFYKATTEAKTVKDIIENTVAKRYPATRIKRTLIHMLHRYKRDQHQLFFNHSSFHPYLRILAFNEKGREIIQELKRKEVPLPVINNVRKAYPHLDPNQKQLLQIDILSSDLYFLPTQTDVLRPDYRNIPYKKTTSR
ncbi:MAG TPA: nucleotidyltransferase [Eubacteriaceae bacterium]|nr:nucleotidyltransferase [Eubacteriaceae bacterium]